MKLFKYLYISLLFIFIGVESYTQDDFVFKIEKVQVLDQDGKSLQGVNVTIKKDGSTDYNETTARNGRTGAYEMEYDSKYVIKLSKDGYTSMFFDYDLASGYYPDDIAGNLGMTLRVTLYEKEEGHDYGIVENKARGRFNISSQDGNLTLDDGYTNKRQKEIESLLEKIKNAGADEAKKFNDLVKAGDNNFKAKKYDNALNNFNEALKIKDDQGVKDKIENVKKAIEEAKKLEKLKKEYDEKMQEAQSLADNEKYDDAISKYQEAKQILPKEILPDTRISEIKRIIAQKKNEEERYKNLLTKADDYFQNKNYKSAIDSYKSALNIKKDESYPKEQIAKAEKNLKEKAAEDLANKNKEQQYRSFISKAQKNFIDKNYDQAIADYEKALEVKPEESLPTQKINEIKAKIAQIDADYKARMDEGNDLLSQKAYQKSIAKFEAAKKLKPSESEPQTKIDKAKRLMNEALSEKEQLAKKEAEYKSLISKANSQFTIKKYKEAKENYEKALEVKPEESYPKDQLEIIAQKLKELADENEKNELLSKQNEEYDKLIDEADESYKIGDLDNALEKYEKALTIKQEQYPNDQIAEIKKTFKERKENEKVDALYNNIIKEADDKFNAGEYEQALNLYKEAKVSDRSDDYPSKQIQKINQILADEKQKQLDEQMASLNKTNDYNKAIKRGEDYLSNNELEKAEIEFLEARNLFPEEEYPAKQLARIRELILRREENKRGNSKEAEEYLSKNVDEWGEEINLSEDEATLLFNNSRISDDFERYLKIKGKHEKIDEINRDIAEMDIQKSLETKEKLDSLYERMGDDKVLAERGRDIFIESISLNKEANYQDKKELNEDHYQKLKANEQEIENSINRRKEEALYGENRRDDYIFEFNEYKEELAIQKKEFGDEYNSYLLQRQDDIDQIKEQVRDDRASNEEAVKLRRELIEQLQEEDLIRKEVLLENTNDRLAHTQEELFQVKENERFERIENAKRVDEITNQINQQKEDRHYEKVNLINRTDDRLADNYDDINDVKENTRLERIENAQVVKEKTNDIKEQQEDIYQQRTLVLAQSEKNRKETQENIDEVKENTRTRKKELAEQHNDNVDLLEQQKEDIQDEKNRKSENHERDILRAESEINKVKENTREDRINNSSKAKGKQDEVVEQYKKLLDENIAENKLYQQKMQSKHEQLEIQKENLNKSTVNKYPPNELGRIFPEGVTEKIYQSKDAQGKINQITVRRIVVKNEHGIEYKKIINKSGTMYIKGTKSISSQVWDNETRKPNNNSSE